MEHNIMMIPVEALRNHPENPRREIGDVKEMGYEMLDEENAMLVGKNEVFRKPEKA